MALLDKLSAAAKTAKETANTAIEIGKLNLKIKSENDSIERFKGQIGDLMWAQYQEGSVTDPQVVALCESIAAANETIDELHRQIAEARLPEQREAPCEEEDCKTCEGCQPVLEQHCPQCGAVVPEGANFCNNCGAQL